MTTHWAGPLAIQGMYDNTHWAGPLDIQGV